MSVREVVHNNSPALTQGTLNSTGTATECKNDIKKHNFSTPHCLKHSHKGTQDAHVRCYGLCLSIQHWPSN